MTFTKRDDPSQKSGSCVLDASPDMTIYAAANNLTEIKNFYAEFNHLELNLSAVEEIDSSGIQLLLALKHSADKEGKKVVLDSVSPSVEEVMNVLNVKAQFDWKK
ncbi:MAG: anti-sigma B factor antagonist [Gammaproteobacteria bacterium]|jgi:anti-sigma B factor antagonist